VFLSSSKLDRKYATQSTTRTWWVREYPLINVCDESQNANKKKVNKQLGLAALSCKSAGEEIE